METLEENLEKTCKWAVKRVYTLRYLKTNNLVESLDNAHAIQSEFAEWLDPNIEDHEIYSLKCLGEDD